MGVRKGDLGVEPRAKTCDCKLRLPPGDWRMQPESDSAITKLLWCLFKVDLNEMHNLI